MKQAMEQKTVRRASLVWRALLHASPLLLPLLFVGCGPKVNDPTKSDDTEEEETTTPTKKKTKKPNPKQNPKEEPADPAEKDSQDEITLISKPKQRFVKKGDVWLDTKQNILWTKEQPYSTYRDAETYCKNLSPGQWQLPYSFWLKDVQKNGKWQLPGTLYEYAGTYWSYLTGKYVTSNGLEWYALSYEQHRFRCAKKQ